MPWMRAAEQTWWLMQNSVETIILLSTWLSKHGLQQEKIMHQSPAGSIPQLIVCNPERKFQWMYVDVSAWWNIHWESIKQHEQSLYQLPDPKDGSFSASIRRTFHPNRSYSSSVCNQRSFTVSDCQLDTENCNLFSCPHWVRNGFCSNERYTQAHLQQWEFSLSFLHYFAENTSRYCPNACENSGCRTNTTKAQTRSTTPRTTKTTTTTSTTTTTTPKPTTTTTTAPPLENAKWVHFVIYNNNNSCIARGISVAWTGIMIWPFFFCASATKAQKELVCKVTCAKDIVEFFFRISKFICDFQDPIEDCYYQTTENTVFFFTLSLWNLFQAVSARTYQSTSWLALHVSTLKVNHK